MEFHLGKLDPVFPSCVPFLREVAMGKLPATPTTVSAPNPGPSGWGMLGNDQYGNCTIAGAAHEEIVFKVVSNQPTVVPNATQAIDVYLGLTGGADTGLVIANVLATQLKTGLFSAEDELAGGGFARLNEGSLLQLHESIAFYGTAKLGIQCPESAQTQAQEQAETGKVVPWTYAAGSTVEGGHDIEAVGYGNDGGLWCVSWGMLVYVTAGFLSHYLEEAWCPLPKQYREAGHGPKGVDWASLDAALASL